MRRGSPHRGQRLADAGALDARPDIAAKLDATDRAYLAGCRAREAAEAAEAEARRREREEEQARALSDARRIATANRRVAQRTRIGLIAALILAAVATAVGGFALRLRGVAAEQRDSALVTQSRFLADQSRQFAEAGDQAGAMLLAMEALPDSRIGNIRPLASEAEDALYQSLSTLREVAVFSAAGAKIVEIAESDDGRRLVTRQDDGSIRVWDAASDRLAATHGPFGDDLLAAAFDVSSSDRIDLVHKDRSVTSIDAISGAPVALPDASRKLWRDYLQGAILSFSANAGFAMLNRPIAAAEINPTIGAASKTVPLDDANVAPGARLVISDNGATVVSDAGAVWDGKTGKLVARIDLDGAPSLAGVSVSPNGSKIVWRQYGDRLHLQRRDRRDDQGSASRKRDDQGT